MNDPMIVINYNQKTRMNEIWQKIVKEVIEYCDTGTLYVCGDRLVEVDLDSFLVTPNPGKFMDMLFKDCDGMKNTTFESVKCAIKNKNKNVIMLYEYYPVFSQNQYLKNWLFFSTQYHPGRNVFEISHYMSDGVLKEIVNTALDEWIDIQRMNAITDFLKTFSNVSVDEFFSYLERGINDE
jgi:hypothetical protein